MTLFLSLLAACDLPSAEDQAAADLQLESAAVSADGCFGGEGCKVEASGALTVDRQSGDAGVDLAILVGEDSFDVHSPSGADLSSFEGTATTARVYADWMVPTSLELSDENGPFYVVEAGGGAVFGDVEVSYGAELGSIVDDEDYRRTFRALDVTTDDGVVSVKPGDVQTIHLDGQPWRFAAIAAYEVEEIEGGSYSDCGGELSMLSYELVRLPAAQTFEPVKRPEALQMARYSGCGGGRD